MTVSESFLAFALEQLQRVTPVTSRRMFGGAGIYAGGVFFAIIADDVLYFKVDETSLPDFEAAGMGPFRPFGEDGAAMRYYELPGHVLEDAEVLEPWVRKAVGVARARRTKRR